MHKLLFLFNSLRGLKKYISSYVKEFFKNKMGFRNDKWKNLSFDEINSKLNSLNQGSSDYFTLLEKYLRNQSLWVSGLNCEWWSNWIDFGREGASKETNLILSELLRKVHLDEKNFTAFYNLYKLLIFNGHFEIAYSIRLKFYKFANEVILCELSPIEIRQLIEFSIESGCYSRAKMMATKCKKYYPKIYTATFFMCTLFEKKMAPMSNAEKNSDYDFFEYVRGKNISIIAPKFSNLNFLDEIPEDEIILRFNQVQTTFLNESRCDINYLNGSIFQNYLCSFRLKNIHGNWMVLKSEVDVTQYKKICIDPNKLTKVRAMNQVVKSSGVFESGLHAVPNVLFDLAVTPHLRIKLFNADAYLTLEKTSGYPSSDGIALSTKRFLNSSAFAHDPFLNFMLVKKFMTSGLLEADLETTQIFQMEPHVYAMALQEKYKRTLN